jgi:DNA polymerase-1
MREVMPKSDRPTLILIDGHALAYRMFFALSAEAFSVGKTGEPTNATYGFTRALLDIIMGDSPPDYIAVSFDTGATFRDELFDEYKATREKMPDELRLQIERIREVIQAFNIPILEAEGYEADDVLGTVAEQAAEEGVDVVIVTGDRDLLQLVDDHIRVQLPGRRLGDVQLYDVAAVQEKYDLTPQQLIDLKAMMGDTSDNIPGVPGVGEKTGTKLLQEYGTLEGIYEHLEEITATRARNALAEYRETAFLSQQLGRIVTDAPVTLDLEACRTHDYDRDQVTTLFRELEFRSLVGRLPREGGDVSGQQLPLFASSETGPSLSAGITTAHLVDTEEALDALVRRLESAEAIAFDVETTSTDQMQAELVGIALAVQPGEGYYIPVGHRTPGVGQLPLEMVIERLRPALTNPTIKKVAHNIKYDAIILARYGLNVTPLSFDTMIAEWLCTPGASRGSLGLKSLAFLRLDVEMTPIEDLIGKGAKQITMDLVPVERVTPYAAADADVTLRMVDLLEADMQSQGVWELFQEVEMPLVPVLAAMEQAGVLVDVELLAAMSDEFGERLSGTATNIYELVGYTFNINSTQQLSDALFGKLMLPTQGMRKTKSGHYSTAAGVLEELVEAHPVVPLILEYREIDKLKSTYLDALPRLVNPETGRIHTSYNQTGTVTGRLSSSDPNLQNIPIRTELGRRVRDAFIAAPGHKLLGADYSQVELRILAHVSEDPGLIAAFQEDLDIHASTAAAVYGVPIDQVTREQRSFAKSVNFGLMYGMGAFRLSRDSGLTLAEAENFVRGYFERFPRVKGYLEATRRQATEHGYVETLMHRRRYFPIFQREKASSQRRAAAEREAINMPIQGTAADIIKVAMINLHRELIARGLHGMMTLQVHDELVLEVPDEEVAETAELVKSVMMDAYPLIVPLKVDISIGAHWGEMK